MTQTDKSKWPQWLQDADTEDAVVEIINGNVIWRSGEWYSGEWRNGVWCDGVWHDGVWHDGIWRNGEWHSGTWREGWDNPTRCMFHVRGQGDTIRVGCKSYTLSEAEALCEDGDLPDEAPARDSEAGRLLRASVLAQIAWQRALND